MSERWTESRNSIKPTHVERTRGGDKEKGFQKGRTLRGGRQPPSCGSPLLSAAALPLPWKKSANNRSQGIKSKSRICFSTLLPRATLHRSFCFGGTKGGNPFPFLPYRKPDYSLTIIHYSIIRLKCSSQAFSRALTMIFSVLIRAYFLSLDSIIYQGAFFVQVFWSISFTATSY